MLSDSEENLWSAVADGNGMRVGMPAQPGARLAVPIVGISFKTARVMERSAAAKLAGESWLMGRLLRMTPQQTPGGAFSNLEHFQSETAAS